MSYLMVARVGSRLDIPSAVGVLSRPMDVLMEGDVRDKQELGPTTCTRCNEIQR